jgi:hypothetical protein
MAITQAEIDSLAQKAFWYVDVQLSQTRVKDDWAIYAGDGLDDLDRLIALMQMNPNGRYKANVGSLTSSYRWVDASDMLAVRAAFIAFYGNVNKPTVVSTGTGAMELSFPKVQA